MKEKHSALGRILLVLLVIAIIAGGAIFFYRYKILQYSADAIIRNILPSYVTVDKITFDAAGSKLILNGFRIMNPPVCQSRYLFESSEILCRYRMRGKTVLDGIEVLEPVFQRPVLTIERLADGTLNIQRMPEFIRSFSAKDAVATPSAEKKPTLPAEVRIDEQARAVIGDRTAADVVTLPETFVVKNGRLVCIDRLVARDPHTISIDRIEAEMTLKLNKAYTAAAWVASTGRGILNNASSQSVKWTSSYDPTHSRLTMSNRFDVSGLNILVFKPYYNQFSPFDFTRGNFSGQLVFDFSDGNIGSTNEIRLSNLAFSMKQGYNDAAFWNTSAADLAKYFTTTSGDIVFDFKIKGDMAKPQFMLGPISKQAVTAMAVDKVSQVLQSVIQQTSDVTESGEVAAGGEKTDVQKAAEYIGKISDLISQNR